MHQLRGVAADLEGMNELIEGAMSDRRVQMVTLDLNPFWCALHRLEDAGLDPDSFPWWELGMLASQASLNGGKWDLGRRYKVAAERIRTYFSLGTPWESRSDSYQPYLARIVLRPAPGDRRNLIEIARRMPFPVLLEVRSEPVPLFGAGDSCSKPSPGVIGGFLRDRNSNSIYGTTCGHVAAPNDLVEVAGTAIGTCSALAHNPFAAGPTAVLCRPNCQGVQRVDLALISLTQAPPTNIATSIDSQVQKGDSIDLHIRGRRRRYEVGGVVLTASIRGVCFDRLYEVCAPTSGILNARVGTAFARMPKPGHSGAWLLRSGTDEWCGVLVAGEPLMAYALESDDLLAEADTLFQTQLELA